MEYQGTFGIHVLHRDHGKSYAMGRIRVPGEAVEKSGLTTGTGLAFERNDSDIIVSRFDTSKRKMPGLQVGGVHSLLFYGKTLGLAAIATDIVDVPISADEGVIRFTIPESLPAQEKQPDGERKTLSGRESWIDAVAGLRGTEAVVALDANRNGNSNRPITMAGMIRLLKDSGHAVEPISARLFRFDGRTASVAELLEAAHRIDTDVILVTD